ncbi:MAG: energy transducer TonB [Oceanihabitans sp.]|nr:energy transducer TonB [Oceanihabitans sp.]
MKKSLIILCAVLITLSLTAFGVLNWKDIKTEASEKREIAMHSTSAEKENTNANYQGPVGPLFITQTEKTKRIEDFNYNVGPRFGPIKKSDIDKATTIEDFFSWEALRAIEILKSVEIIIIENDRQTQKREIGYSKTLTKAQLKLLQTADYAASFLIRIDFQEKNKVTEKLQYNYASPHLTIVPEKQAAYINGKDALQNYLKENSKEVRKEVDQNKLQPAKLYFTVTKEGNIENIRLDRTSNYPLVDKAMIELITKTNKKWKPAENEKGEKIDQELVVSFGLLGC